MRVEVDIPSAWQEAGANAIEVVRALRKRRFQAYLVGGCVRDLLLGTVPQDFDVATSARPGQIIGLFGSRRARRVGRRFPIVLVRSGERGAPAVEVTTFRGEGSRVQSTEGGQIHRDASFGSLQQDVQRRDLSINALYLDFDQSCVYDHVDGIEDIQRGLIRIIGDDPSLRLREDPVRLLRCIRFSSRLEMDFAPETRAALDGAAVLLREVAPARLYDEFYKTLAHHRWERAWELLLELDVLRHAFPMLAAELRDPSSRQEAMVRTALEVLAENPNRWRGAKRQILFYAALLWNSLDRGLDAAGPPERTRNRSNLLRDNGMLLLHHFGQHIRIPDQHRIRVLNLWRLQGRLELRSDPQQTVTALSYDDALRLFSWRIRSGQIDDLGRLSFWRSQPRPSASEMYGLPNRDGGADGRSERRSGRRRDRDRRRHRRRGRN